MSGKQSVHLITGKSQGHTRRHLGGRTEMLSCIDLIDRGFTPYRAVTQHAPYDVIAAADGIVLRIECRSAQFNKATGNLAFSKRGSEGQEACDLFAVWNPMTGEILYFLPDGVTPADPRPLGALEDYA